MKYGIFDIMGPIMIGPSSSHTAGAVKIAHTALYIGGEDFSSVEFILDGSFAETYRGHGTDKALLAGIMGFMEDDERIRDAYEIAEERGLNYEFREEDLNTTYANVAKIILRYDSPDKETMEIIGASIGGGNIRIISINGVDVVVDSKYPVLIMRYEEQTGVIAKVSSVLASHGYSIHSVKTVRGEQEVTLIINLYDEISKEVEEEIREIECLIDVKYIHGYRRGIDEIQGR